MVKFTILPTPPPVLFSFWHTMLYIFIPLTYFIACRSETKRDYERRWILRKCLALISDVAVDDVRNEHRSDESNEHEQHLSGPHWAG